MSIAIVLSGWVAASILLSPLIGRFLSVQDESEGRETSRQRASRPAPAARLRQGSSTSMRRNVAIPLSRRDAGWPRAG